MSFHKQATNTSLPAQPLNNPQGWEIFNLPNRIKTASLDKSKDEDLGGFDLEAALNEHPDDLYIKIFAIKQDEVNDNGDAFSASELEKSAETFIGVPIFTNHQNDDVEKSRGECVHAWYDPDAQGIYIIARVDKVAYPKLARGIEEGYIWGCFPPDAPVLMSDGTEKHICDIEDGDEVITHKGRARSVRGIRQRGYNYPIYSIKLEGLEQPLRCTAYHHLMAYKLSEECLCGYGEELPERKDNRMTAKSFDHKFALGHNTKEQKLDYNHIQKLKANELDVGDFLFEPKVIDDSEDNLISEEEAFLIGLFLAKGSYEKRQGERHAAIFSFGSNELETLACRCSDLLESVFSNHRNKPKTDYYPGASQTRVTLYGKYIADWFYQYCGEYSDGKKIDSRLIQLGVEKTAALLAGYVEGDGYNISGKTYGAETVSSDLASQLRLLFQKIGVLDEFKMVDDPKRWGYKPVHEITFRITTANKLKDHLIYKQANEPEYNTASWHEIEDLTFRRIESIEEIEYDGLVYDIEVEEDHSYCVNHVAVSNTSMGCAVSYSICSICHNRASMAEDYCSHVKEMKNRTRTGRYKCSYHDSPSKPQDNCPVCGCEAGEEKVNDLKEAEVFEWNYGLKFIENSFVVNPACHTCGVHEVLHAPEVSKKIAQLKESTDDLIKAKQANNETHSFNESCAVRPVHQQEKAASANEKMKTTKEAGQAELTMLKESMENMEQVVQSMMQQKDQVDMEYVSDLVKAMADMQDTIDELTEMGYGQLPSPKTGAQPSQEQQTGQADWSFPETPTQNQSQPQPQSQPSSNPGQKEVMDGLGTITGSIKNNSIENQKKDFVQSSAKVRKRISDLSDRISKVAQATRRDNMIDVWTDNSNSNSLHVAIDDEFVTEAKGDKVLRVSNISELPEGWQEFINSNPKQAANQILNKINKESSSTMADKEHKHAQVGPNPKPDSDQQEVITEKQMDQNSPDTHPRWGNTYETITQDYLSDGGDRKLNDTTGESPQTRRGTYETITEDQFDKISSDYVVRWQNAPEVITEKQWDDWSKHVSAQLPDEWQETITQDQLRNLLSNHTFVGTYETITEDQLKNQNSGIKRWANRSYVNKLTKIATQSVSDAIARFRKSPNELRRVVAELDGNPSQLAKIAQLTVINSLPYKNDNRSEVYAHANYFTKIADKDSGINGRDALMLTVAENAKAGVKAEDVYETIGRVLSEKKAMDKVNNLVEKKTAETDKDDETIDKFAALNDALEELDGVALRATFNDVNNADPNDKATFVSEVNKLAKKKVGQNYRVASIKVNKQAGTLEVLLETLEDMLNGELSEDDTLPEDDMGEDMEEVEVQFVGDEPVDEESGGEEFGGEEAEGDVSSEVEEIEPTAEDEEESPSEESSDDELEEDHDMAGGNMSPGGASVGTPGGNAPSGSANTGKSSTSQSPAMASSNKQQKRAQRRQKMQREAQLQGGEMGGQGGASQQPGAGATLPDAPNTEQNPVESFDTNEGGGNDMGGFEEEEDLSPKPPGSICCVCGSEDVDIIAGKGKCNNCSSEFQYKVTVEVTKWADLTGDVDNGDQEGDDFEGEGFEMPEGSTPEGEQPEVPVAAMTKIKPETIQKLSEQGIEIGSISPVTGTTNTMKLANGQRVCLDSGTSYNVEFAVPKQASKDKPPYAYAQWSWTPKVAENVCPSCSRSRKMFTQALKEAGISESDFDQMSIPKKAKTLVNLKKSGSLKQVKTASQNGSVLEDFKRAYAQMGDSFPIERCREKLARRYGMNAVGMSGPCEGKPIHDCVCNQLKSAGIYSDKLAIKVAQSWDDRDGTEECIEDFVRLDMNIREAAVACSMLKTKVAADEDLLADELASEFDDDPEGGPNGPDSMTENNMGIDLEDDVDPFSNEAEGTVTLELSEDVAKELDSKLDAELGSDPTDDLTPEDDMYKETDEAPSEEVGEIEGETAEDLESKPCMNKDLHGVEGENEDTYECGCPKESHEDDEDDKNSEKYEGGVFVASNETQDNQTKEAKSYNNMQKQAQTHSQTEPQQKEASADDQEQLLSFMQQRVGGVGKANGLDYAGIARSLGMTKEADEKEIEHERVQESDGIGSYSEGNALSGNNNSEMGNEDKTVRDADHPDVPDASDGRMAHENENIGNDNNLPNIPSDEGTMGHEDDTGLEGGDTRFTGGTGTGAPGAGSAEYEEREASSKDQEKTAEDQIIDQIVAMRGNIGNSQDRMDDLIQRVATKLKEKEPVYEDEDTKPHSTGDGMGHEPDFSVEYPDNTEGSKNESMMAHEKETLEETPKSPQNHPDVPEDEATMGHEDDNNYDPEKQVKDKGTVIAEGSGEESKQGAKEEAFRVAGRMVQEEIINPQELHTKVAELSQYTPALIRDYEKAAFSNKTKKQSSKKVSENKGLDTVSEGLERPLVINERSNQKDGNNELVSKLQSMFGLEQQNKIAQEQTDFSTNQKFGRS